MSNVITSKTPFSFATESKRKVRNGNFEPKCDICGDKADYRVTFLYLYEYGKNSEYPFFELYQEMLCRECYLSVTEIAYNVRNMTIHKVERVNGGNVDE